jgi:hypothetical protein
MEAVCSRGKQYHWIASTQTPLRLNLFQRPRLTATTLGATSALIDRTGPLGDPANVVIQLTEGILAAVQLETGCREGGHELTLTKTASRGMETKVHHFEDGPFFRS